MKKIIFVFGLMLVLTACNSSVTPVSTGLIDSTLVDTMEVVDSALIDTITIDSMN